MALNQYEDEDALRRDVENGKARDSVGGLWDEIGPLQLAFLQSRGLRPEHRFLDLGCGCMRAGVHVVPYLNVGNYHGIDLSPSLILAGWQELRDAGVDGRVPAGNVRETGAFDVSGFPPFDYGVAQSVFTHLPLPHFVACLKAIRPHFTNGGRFFATFFTASPGVTEQLHARGNITSYHDRDPFHFSIDMILHAAQEAGWRPTWLGEWRHPRDQQMCELTPL